MPTGSAHPLSRPVNTLATDKRTTIVVEEDDDDCVDDDEDDAVDSAEPLLAPPPAPPVLPPVPLALPQYHMETSSPLSINRRRGKGDREDEGW